MIKKVFKVSVVVCFCAGLVPMTAEGVTQINPPSLDVVNGGLKWTPTPAPRIGAFAAQYEDPETKTLWDFGAKHITSTNDDAPELSKLPSLSVSSIDFLRIGPEESARLNVTYTSLNGWTVYASSQGPANAVIAHGSFEIPDEAPEDPFGRFVEVMGASVRED